MNVDNNWKETRILAEDLDLLIGVPPETSEKFLKILENLIIHRLTELVCNEDSDIENKDYQIELPYLGSLVVSTDNKRKVTVNFTVNSSFYRKIRSGVLSRESSLIEQCSKILGEDLANRFKENGNNYDQ